MISFIIIKLFIIFFIVVGFQLFLGGILNWKDLLNGFAANFPQGETIRDMFGWGFYRIYCTFLGGVVLFFAVWGLFK